MGSFKHNQKQSELYDEPLYTHPYYFNYQLIVNFVLPISLYSSPHYFEAVFRHHVNSPVSISVLIAKIEGLKHNHNIMITSKVNYSLK